MVGYHSQTDVLYALNVACVGPYNLLQMRITQGFKMYGIVCPTMKWMSSLRTCGSAVPTENSYCYC